MERKHNYTNIQEKRQEESSQPRSLSLTYCTNSLRKHFQSCSLLTSRDRSLYMLKPLCNNILYCSLVLHFSIYTFSPLLADNVPSYLTNLTLSRRYDGHCPLIILKTNKHTLYYILSFIDINFSASNISTLLLHFSIILMILFCNFCKYCKLILSIPINTETQ